MSQEIFDSIVRQSERYLAEHGDNNLGVGWPTRESADTHYRVMLDLVPASLDRTVEMVDVGCGTGGLLEALHASGRKDIRYTGVDVSTTFLAECRRKFPDVTFHQADLLRDPESIGRFDYVIANGIFTQKCELDFDSMWTYAQRMIAALWSRTEAGLAFNVMSKQVDWERDDLFHLPLDTLADFLCRQITRRFVIRNDYGYYDYTVYVTR